MSAISVLVADDEPLARGRLVRLLNKLDWIGRIDEAGDVAQAGAALDALDPNILLLDIHMPGGSGFDLLSRLSHPGPVVVFVTAFDHYALQAFEADAIDYVTKPIQPGRFYMAMERARSRIGTRSSADRIVELEETVASLRAAVAAQSKSPGDFWVKGRGDYLRLPLDAIIRFQAERDYVRIHTVGANYLYHESLASLGRRLPETEFIRIHRSTIVRRDAIVRVKTTTFSALTAILSDASEMRVGRTYAPAIRASLLQGRSKGVA